jgi:formylmethanofuran dehydrogenase subunit E
MFMVPFLLDALAVAFVNPCLTDGLSAATTATEGNNLEG